MFMRLLRSPKLHVLLVDMYIQMKMVFVTKENQAKIIWVVVLNSFTDGLTEFDSFVFIGISFILFLENLCFLWKQL